MSRFSIVFSVLILCSVLLDVVEARHKALAMTSKLASMKSSAPSNKPSMTKNPYKRSVGIVTGTGLSGGGWIKFGQSVTLENEGVLSLSVSQGLENIGSLQNPSIRVAEGGITAELLGDNAVVSESILDGEVDTVDIANDAVTEDKLADGAVTNSKLSLCYISASKYFEAQYIIFQGVETYTPDWKARGDGCDAANVYFTAENKLRFGPVSSTSFWEVTWQVWQRSGDAEAVGTITPTLQVPYGSAISMSSSGSIVIGPDQAFDWVDIWFACSNAASSPLIAYAHCGANIVSVSVKELPPGQSI